MNKQILTGKYKRYILSGTNLASVAVNSLFGLYISYFLLRICAVEVFNSFTSAIAASTLILSFINLSGREYMMRTLSKHPSQMKILVNQMLNARLLILIPGWLSLVFIPVQWELKCFMAFILFTKSLAPIVQVLVSIRKKFIWQFIPDFILIVSFSFSFWFNTLLQQTWPFLATYALLEALRLWPLLTLFRKYFQFRFEPKKALEMIKASLPFYWLTLFSFLSTKVDIYVLGWMQGEEKMNLYFTLLQLVSLATVGYSTIINTFESNILRLNFSSFHNHSKATIPFSIFFSVMAGLVIYVICNYYYHINFHVFDYLLCSLHCLFFTRTLVEVFRSTRLNRQDILLKTMIYTAAANLLLSGNFIYFWGTHGALLSNTLCAMLSWQILKYLISKAERVKDEVADSYSA